MKGSIIHLHSSSFSFISQNKRLYFLGASFVALITYVIAQELEKKNPFWHSLWISEGLTRILCIIGKSCIWDGWRHPLARCILFQATLFPEAAALLHGARLFSLSLFHLLLQGSYGKKLCQSTRALVLVFISDCLHPIWLRCTFNHVFTLRQNCLGTWSRHAAVEHATCALQKYLFDFLPPSIIQ